MLDTSHLEADDGLYPRSCSTLASCSSRRRCLDIACHHRQGTGEVDEGLGWTCRLEWTGRIRLCPVNEFSSEKVQAWRENSSEPSRVIGLVNDRLSHSHALLRKVLPTDNPWMK